MTSARSTLREHRSFIILTIAAFVAAAGVWFGLPHSREIQNLGELLLKLVPFVLAVEAIAHMRLSDRVRRALALAAVPVCFLVYFTNFVPRIFFENGQGRSVYFLLLTVTPFIILSLVLAYRLGGGSGGMARRLGYAMILLQLSGLEDLAYLTVNPHTDPEWTSIPAVWEWADHMTVFVGRPLTKNEAFVFIAIHVVLALLILTLPDRFWRRMISRRQRPVTEPDPAPARRMESV
jgi:hypothetical protein